MPMRKLENDSRVLLERTRVFLWRHPEVAGGPEGKFWGHADVALSKKGKEQARLVVERMRGERLDAVYASDLQRARLPGEAIARSRHPRLKLAILPALRELALGVWEGLTYAEVARRYPAELEARSRDLVNFAIEGGESLEGLAHRVIPAFSEIVAAHPRQNVCVVAHGGVNRVILARLLGAPLDRVFRIGQEYACLNVIDVYGDGVPVVKLVNQPVEKKERLSWD